MKIEFLGTGTSTGVPQIGCNCKVCTSADEKDKRLRSSVLLSEGQKKVLVDCGPDFRQQALQTGIKHIDAVLLTHEHYDHVGGLDDIRPLGDMAVYGEQRVLDAVKRCMPYCFGTQRYPGAPKIDLHPIEPNTLFTAAGWEFLPIRVMHGHLPIVGYRTGRMAYLTDVKTISDEAIQQLQTLDVLILNALRYEPHPAHLSLQEALQVAARIGAKRTFFTHFSHHLGLHAVENTKLPAGVWLAYDGLSVEFER